MQGSDLIDIDVLNLKMLVYAATATFSSKL